MKARIPGVAIAALVLAGIAGSVPAQQQAPMTFFVTSVGSGKGADFGGLAGADKHCQTLAAKAGAGKRVWRAYLSTSAASGSPAVHAAERVGKGPWHNAKGVLISRNVEDLHDSNNINKQTALTERGEQVNGRGDTPNLHDILTGSQPNGKAIAGSADTTCGNWTKNSDGSAQVGHHDRLGLRDDEASRSWNSSHGTKGCSQEALAATGGGGLIYCFAAK